MIKPPRLRYRARARALTARDNKYLLYVIHGVYVREYSKFFWLYIDEWTRDRDTSAYNDVKTFKCIKKRINHPAQHSSTSHNTAPEFSPAAFALARSAYIYTPIARSVVFCCVCALFARLIAVGHVARA